MRRASARLIHSENTMMMKIFTSLAIAATSSLMLLLCSGAAMAETNEEGAAAITQGEFARAEKIFRALAGKGDAAAQFSLGSMHNNGQGVAKDYLEAVKWYRLAAAQGHTGAQSTMGYMYYNGQGVQQDYVKAHMWFSIAAAKGSGIAQKLRDKIAALMSATQLAQSQEMVTACESSSHASCD